MHLHGEGKTYIVDARPSDAIAIALRTDAPIFVEEKVIENQETSISAPTLRTWKN